MPSTKGKSPVRRGSSGRGRKTSLSTVIWAVVTLALSVTFLIVQGTLLLIFTALSLVITGLSALADRAASMDAVPAPRAKTTKQPQPGSSGGKRPSGPVVRCTVTGQPTDKCTCARRHVTTADGAARYKRNVGDPLGTGKKP